MIEGRAPRDGNAWGVAGKVAIVTGAGAAGDGIGNGRAAAILLARAGAAVLAVDRDATLAERTAEIIVGENGSALAFAADVSTEEGCRDAVAFALAHWGRLDLLDNNVGIASRGSVVAEELATWRRVMQVNVESVFLMARHAIPAMTRTAGGGAIVNVSSISAVRPRGLTAYSTSKGAVIALTKAMAVDHGPDGIRVNCVAPGPMYTPMMAASGMTEAQREARRDASLIRREGTGWDVGEAVRFLLSDCARYVTGQTLLVDGGASLKGPDRGAG